MDKNDYTSLLSDNSRYQIGYLKMTVDMESKDIQRGNFWENRFGFMPEKEFDVNSFEHKCYKCDSNNIVRLPASAWSDKYRCNDCQYYTYVIYSDKMGGNTPDSVAIDIKDGNMIVDDEYNHGGNR